MVPLQRVNDVVGSPAHEDAAALAAERSITLARDSASVLPLDPRTTRSLAVIAFGSPNDVNAGKTLAQSRTGVEQRHLLRMLCEEELRNLLPH